MRGLRALRAATWIACVSALPLAARAQSGGVTEADAPHLGACEPVPGAYQLPGTAACLRLSGFVAADLGGWRAPAAPLTDPLMAVPRKTTATSLGESAIGADARLSADVRVPTDYGPARVYVSVRARHGVLNTAR
jgi:hypothetical protein